MTMENKPLLQVKDLTVTFGERHNKFTAVKNVSFDIFQGETFGLVGESGSGKTTLIEKIIALLASRGLKVSAVKNAHHNVDIDKPGKDSYRFREAGATQVIVHTDERWAMLTETPKDKPTLSDLIRHLDPADIVIVEGFKTEEQEALRLEVWRKLERHETPICAHDKRISAVVTDTTHPAFGNLPIFDINDAETITRFIVRELGLEDGETRKC